MPEWLTCEWCGSRFSRPNPHGPIPKFCRASHRQRSHESGEIGRWLAKATDAELARFGVMRISQALDCHDGVA